MTKTRSLCLLLCVPLLGIAPLGHFVIHYYDGVGSLASVDRSDAFLYDAVFILVVPWLMAALFTALARGKWSFRLLIFVSVLILQVVMTFKIAPAGNTSEMMGLAHTIRQEYSIDQTRTCANQLRQKQHEGTLKLKADDTGKIGSIFGNGVIVDDLELPTSLRGRFTQVVIWHVPDTLNTEVRFGLNQRTEKKRTAMERTEIICGQSEIGDPDQEVGPLDEYPLAEGVYIYHWHRTF